MSRLDEFEAGLPLRRFLRELVLAAVNPERIGQFERDSGSVLRIRSYDLVSDDLVYGRLEVGFSIAENEFSALNLGDGTVSLPDRRPFFREAN